MPRYTFTTTSAFAEVPSSSASSRRGGDDAVQLYRGHRLFTQPSADELLEAARQGGAYLARATDEDGKFIYQYQPITDTVPDTYNLVRHAGTAYAMLEIYEVTHESALLSAAQRAISYLLKFVRPCPDHAEETACVVEPDERALLGDARRRTEDGVIKLGGNALTALTLAKYTEVTHDDRYRSILQRLGARMLRTQQPNGAFYPQRQTYPAGTITPFRSRYYPGEAMLAMMRVYRLDADDRWLDAVERAAHYLIRVCGQGEPPHDHWLLYALNELYRARPDPTYLAHALRVAGAIRRSQHRDPAYPDWFGGYGEPPRSGFAAIRSEGLWAAYCLARDFGDPQEAQEILRALQLGVAFQLQTQFRPDSALYFRRPQRVLGGFHRSLTNFDIRIDDVQHNISGLLGLYRVLRASERSNQLSDEQD
jgi:hypothetical protein